VSELAAILGRFVGAVLKECGPTIVDILAAAIRKAFNDSIEDGKAPEELRNRLTNDLRSKLAERVRDQSGDTETRGPDSDSTANQSEGVGVR